MQTTEAIMTPAELETWARELYAGAVDNMDAAAFAAIFTDDAWMRFANAEPVVGRAAIEAAIAGFFTAIAGLRHEFTGMWCQGDAVILESDVTYTRHDRRLVTVPAVTILRMVDADGRRLARRCQMFVDLTPLFAP